MKPFSAIEEVPENLAGSRRPGEQGRSGTHVRNRDAPYWRVTDQLR